MEENPSFSSPHVQGEVGEVKKKELAGVAVGQECPGPHSSMAEPEDKGFTTDRLSGESCDPGTAKVNVTVTNDRDALGGESESPVQSGGPPSTSTEEGRPGFTSGDPIPEKKEAWIKFDSPAAKAEPTESQQQQQSNVVEGGQKTQPVPGDKMMVEDIELEDSVAPAALADIQGNKSPEKEPQVNA